MYWYAVSIDCMPEPQLICTVNAVIASPMPSRSAATRAGFISSAMTLTQPRMTWSKASGANGWRSSSGRPHCDGKIDRRERARPPARLDERRAAAVDDVDRTARLFRGRRSATSLAMTRLPGAALRDSSSRRKSHRRRRAAATAAAAAWSCAASASLMMPCCRALSISRTLRLAHAGRATAAPRCVSSKARSSRASPSSPVP